MTLFYIMESWDNLLTELLEDTNNILNIVPHKEQPIITLQKKTVIDEKHPWYVIKFPKKMNVRVKLLSNNRAAFINDYFYNYLENFTQQHAEYLGTDVTEDNYIIPYNKKTFKFVNYKDVVYGFKNDKVISIDKCIGKVCDIVIKIKPYGNTTSEVNKYGIHIMLVEISNVVN
jgi:hypothetical protein